MRCVHFVLLASLLALAGLALPGAAQDSQPQGFHPLLLDGETSLDVEASPGLELGSESTIEFVVAALWEPDDGVEDFPAVLGRREPYEGDDPAGAAAATQYSVHLAPDRKAIGLFDGTRFASVPFDFSDGELHHVALVTSGGRTTVYVDREKIGVLELGLGAPSDLPLHLGSSDGGSELFVGTLPSVRLWRAALTEDEVAAIASVFGAPDEGVPAEKLAAYLDAGGEAPALVVRNVPVTTAPLPTRPARKPSAAVGTRGFDKLKARLPTRANQQQKRIEKREVIRARIQRFANPDVTTETVDYGGGVKFTRPAKSQRELARDMKKFEKLSRQIDDYNARLPEGPPNYVRGRFGRRRPAAQEVAAAVEPEPPDAPAVPPPRMRRLALPPRPYAEGEPRIDEELVGPEGDRFRVRRALGAGAYGKNFIVEEEGGGEADGDADDARIAVLKHALQANQVEDAQERDTAEQNLARGNQRRQRLGRETLSEREIIERTTFREVEMQNLAAGPDADGNPNPFVRPAELVAANRIKQRFEGQSLKRLLAADEWQGAPEPVKVAAFEVLARGALEAAASLHQRGVVHRDIHPGNLTVDATGRVRLIDFGLAKRVDESDLALEVDYGVGNNGVRGAMAPPEASDAAADLDGSFKAGPRHDVFSLGMLLDAMREGQRSDNIGALLPPRESQKNAQGAPLLRNGKFVMKPRENAALDRLDEVIDQLVDRDPARRPADARAALAALGPDFASSPEDRAAAITLLTGKVRAATDTLLATDFDAAMGAELAQPPRPANVGLPPARPPPRRPAAQPAPQPAAQ